MKKRWKTMMFVMRWQGGKEEGEDDEEKIIHEKKRKNKSSDEKIKKITSIRHITKRYL